MYAVADRNCVSFLINECFVYLSQIIVERFHYFTSLRHYYRIAFYISVMLYLLPVTQAITVKQIGYGAITVMLSWINLLQFLKLFPVLGVYIIVVEKVFWTLMKVCIFLL